MPVEVVGWGPEVSAALDRAEDLARLAIFGGVLVAGFVVFTLAWIAMQGLRR